MYNMPPREGLSRLVAGLQRETLQVLGLLTEELGLRAAIQGFKGGSMEILNQDYPCQLMRNTSK
jgi:hypothetical protein